MRRSWRAAAAILLAAACTPAEPAPVSRCDGEIPAGTTVTVVASEGVEADVYREAIAAFNRAHDGEPRATVERPLLSPTPHFDGVTSITS
ncbi:MAG TPA: hypothetical protein VK891_09335, partial [Euzebyales bacterium]|nr:hypothetical protein [Euzebyales bacterium]